MLEYKELEDYLQENYPEREDTVGLLLDILNGNADEVDIFNEVRSFNDHNG